MVQNVAGSIHLSVNPTVNKYLYYSNQALDIIQVLVYCWVDRKMDRTSHILHHNQASPTKHLT